MTMLAALALIALADTVVLERGVDLPGYGRYLAVEDTVLDSTEGDLPQGGASALISGNARPVLIQFLDLDRAIGRGKRVTKATLELIYTRGKPKLRGARRVLVPWTEGPIASVAGELRSDIMGAQWAATFRNRRGGIDPIPWQIAGARGDTETEPIPGVSAEVKDDKVVISGLEKAVQTQMDRWFDNHGFMLEFDENTDFLSSSASEGRPRLILELEAASAPAKGPDLSVTLIARTPEYERYDVLEPTMADQDGVPIPVFDKVGNPTSKRWPDDGEKLTYAATIKNVGDAPAGAFEAQWLARETGLSIVSVDKPLGPGESTTLQVEIPYRSAHNDHRVQPVALRLFPKTAEANRANDFLEIQQSALNVSIAVTQSAADAIRKNGVALEDWLQEQVRHWNEVDCRYSRFSFAPDGALERLRIQKIEVVPDDAPAPAKSLAFDAQIVLTEPSSVTAQFARACGLVSLTTEGLRGGSKTADGLDVNPSIDRWPGLLGGGEIRSEALLAPSLPFPYDQFSDVVLDPERMEVNGPLSATDVYALNRNLGRRRGFFGDYLYDIPSNVIVTFTDNAYRRLGNAEVEMYQMRSGSFAGTTPIAKGKTGPEGTLILPRRDAGVPSGFYTATGHTIGSNPFGRIDPNFGNGALLLKVTRNGVTAYGVLKLWQVLDAAARVKRPLALMTVRLNLPAVPLADANGAQGKAAKGPAGALPEVVDGNDQTAIDPGAWVEIDLGEDKTIGEVTVIPSGAGEWTYDVMVYATEEKPEAARLYARERDLGWSMKVRSEKGTLPYRALPQKGRFIRIVTKKPAAGVKLAEVKVRTGQ